MLVIGTKGIAHYGGCKNDAPIHAHFAVSSIVLPVRPLLSHKAKDGRIIYFCNI